MGDGTLTLVALLMFLGAAGKSAQFPFHVWLPDAMEGPTPVSALIHAATMVAAGVYLVARMFPLFEAAPGALEVVLIIGIITAFVAGSMALVMNDLKRVLAYSTVSQLGFMMMALGAGGLSAGIFHLVTHGFFKALLFLGAGSVLHAIGEHYDVDIRKLGGLWRTVTRHHRTIPDRFPGPGRAAPTERLLEQGRGPSGRMERPEPHRYGHCPGSRPS